MSLTPSRIAGLLAGIIMIGLGGWWVVAPHQLPFTGLARLRISDWLPEQLVGWPLIGLGVAGLLLALVPRRARSIGVQLGAVAVAVLLLIAYQGTGTLSAIGYGIATMVPVLLLAGTVLVVIKVPRLRWIVLMGLAVVIAAGAALGFGNAAAWQGLIDRARSLTGSPWMLIVPLILAAGAGQLWLAVAARPEPLRRALAVITRRRRPITVAAAACFLPYAVVRLLWLADIELDRTLFGVGGPDTADQRLDVTTRLWGASLGVASVLGGVAVLGLICRWGEVFPRRLPIIGGRTVPVWLAVGPGMIAGLAFLSMLPWAIAGLAAEFPRSLLTGWVLPFPIWGPLLIMAPLGYLGHRRAARTGPVPQ